MAITISFELSDQDVQHFISMAKEAQAAVEKQGKLDAEAITAATQRLLDEAGDLSGVPGFIAERLRKLQVLVSMITDSEWQLPAEDLKRVLSAMAYFAEPQDLIPDRVPGIGFLDDAIMVELVVATLDPEIQSYGEFCEFRKAEEQRRRNAGQDPHVGREDWLADQRAVLHLRMRTRRNAMESEPSGWRVRLW